MLGQYRGPMPAIVPLKSGESANPLRNVRVLLRRCIGQITRQLFSDGALHISGRNENFSGRSSPCWGDSFRNFTLRPSILAGVRSSCAPLQSLRRPVVCAQPVGGHVAQSSAACLRPSYMYQILREMCRPLVSPRFRFKGHA